MAFYNVEQCSWFVIETGCVFIYPLAKSSVPQSFCIFDFLLNQDFECKIYFTTLPRKMIEEIFCQIHIFRSYIIKKTCEFTESTNHFYQISTTITNFVDCE